MEVLQKGMLIYKLNVFTDQFWLILKVYQSDFKNGYIFLSFLQFFSIIWCCILLLGKPEETLYFNQYSSKVFSKLVQGKWRCLQYPFLFKGTLQTLTLTLSIFCSFCHGFSTNSTLSDWCLNLTISLMDRYSFFSSFSRWKRLWYF